MKPSETDYVRRVFGTCAISAGSGLEGTVCSRAAMNRVGGGGRRAATPTSLGKDGK